MGVPYVPVLPPQPEVFRPILPPRLDVKEGLKPPKLNKNNFPKPFIPDVEMDDDDYRLCHQIYLLQVLKNLKQILRDQKQVWLIRKITL